MDRYGYFLWIFFFMNTWKFLKSVLKPVFSTQQNNNIVSDYLNMRLPNGILK